PGSEAAILLSIANYLIQNDLYNREFVRRWWNWEEYLRSEFGVSGSEANFADEESATGANSQVRKAGLPALSFESFEVELKELYSTYTFEFAAHESGVDAAAIEAIAKLIATAGTR